MNSMIDFYEALNLDANLDIDAINKELSKLESTWKRREITNPEKATRMLSIIIDARQVFQNASSRAVYERELQESKQPSILEKPEMQRLNSLKKWKEDARNYFDSKQFDLAKTAIERALSFADADSREDELYFLATEIFESNNEFQRALEYINQSIVAFPDEPRYYAEKGNILNRLANISRKNNRHQESQKYYQEKRNALEAAMTVAQRIHRFQAETMGCYAYSLYVDPNPDFKRAENLAIQSQQMGDSWGNSQTVLDAIEEKRREKEEEEREKEEAKRRKEEERRWEIYNDAKRKAATKHKKPMLEALAELRTISGWMDVDEKIVKLERRIAQYQSEYDEEIKFKKKYRLIIFVVIASVLIFLFFCGIVSDYR